MTKMHLFADLEARYQRFLQYVLEDKKVYLFADENGPSFCLQSHESEQMIIPVWSKLPYLNDFLKNNPQHQLSSNDIRETDLISFMRNLYLYNRHHMLIGPDYTSDGAGLELPPRLVTMDLVRRFFDEDQSSTDRELLDDMLITGLCYTLAFHVSETEQVLPHIEDPEGHFTAHMKQQIDDAKMLIDRCAFDIESIR